jgi:hypothetical protein
LLNKPVVVDEPTSPPSAPHLRVLHLRYVRLGPGPSAMLRYTEYITLTCNVAMLS